MKRMLSCFVGFLLLSIACRGQKTEQARIDSLLTLLSSAREDTTRINLYTEILYR